FRGSAEVHRHNDGIVGRALVPQQVHHASPDAADVHEHFAGLVVVYDLLDPVGALHRVELGPAGDLRDLAALAPRNREPVVTEPGRVHTQHQDAAWRTVGLARP